MDSKLRELFGAKFVDGGRDPKVGLDCYGLFVRSMAVFGNNLPDKSISAYATEIASKEIGVEIEEKWEELSQPEVGCAVVMAIDPEHPDLVQHLGVYIGDGKFIHIVEKTGVVLTSITDRFWRRKIRGYYKWKG